MSNGNGNKTIKNKNILKLARQLKKTGRLQMSDIDEAEKMLNKMAPGEKKARFGESDDYQDMVANKLKTAMGDLLGATPGQLKSIRPNIFEQTLKRDRIQPPKQRPFRDDGTKPVLDSKGNIVKNLRQKAKQGGQFQEVDVIDLTTEMVIDE
tara:strand:- start:5 stop:460 length:456 start_codon:yes stop_codon:yes gene_type:complete